MRIGGLHHREVEGGGGEGKKMENEGDEVEDEGDEKEYYIRDEGMRKNILRHDPASLFFEHKTCRAHAMIWIGVGRY